MKNKKIFITFLLTLIFPLSAFAMNAPTYDPIPASVDANTYTLKFHTEKGAKITVVGGTADIQPVVDGIGNALDGTVAIAVGLGQGQKNIFSVVASKDGISSDSITLTINEISAKPATQSAQPSQSTATSTLSGDTTPPLVPVVDPIPEEVVSLEYTITGSTESEANIYVRAPGDVLAGSTQANSQGIFSLIVKLEAGKTNRFNISAEDGAGNEGENTQIIIRVPDAKDLPEPTVPVEPTEKPFLFIDVQTHWGKSYIKTLYEEGIINGKNETHFDPDAEITRAELTKIAVNAFFSENPQIPTFQPFSDVPTSAWYAPFIALAKEEGVVSGSSNTFRPNEYINRAEALKILFEASGLPKVEKEITAFTDVPKTAWFYSYVVSAYNHNIISGYFDKTFRPGNRITRAEVSKIVVKIMELVK